MDDIDVKETEAAAKPQGSPAKKILIAVIVIAVLAAIAVAAYLIYQKEAYIEITLPADFVGDAAGGFAGSNPDGSVTYRMPKDRHDELMRELVITFEKSLADMTTPTAVFSAISHNPDYTEFSVTCKSDTLGLSETISRVGLYYIGSFYNMYNGTPAENIKVIYLDPDGYTIDEYNSSDDDGLGQDQSGGEAAQ